MAILDPMQQEAMRRVQAMQSRVPPKNSADASPNSHNRRAPMREENTENSHQQAKEREQSRIKEIASQQSSNPLEIEFRNTEHNIILMLILLLASDNADPGLLLALIYLLI